ncbi:glycoside hydrolase superfamily [Zopfochytrium polystomum]|nr:glycoside hydrolase superfamily [Zopfochytrium polystomum]
MIRDVLGRQRYFRGVNVIYKGHPYHPIIEKFDRQNSFSKEDIQFLADLNVNAIRLGMMWPGAEPTRGEYNQTYFNVIKHIVEECARNGIYVILEMHQDSLSERFCGEGIPLWAVDISSRLDRVGIHRPNATVGFPQPAGAPYELDENGIPSKEDCAKMSWSSYQLTYAAANAYQNLYDNINGIRDAFAKFWQTVALNFKDYPNILGYELINEPFAGQVFENPSLFLPGVADRLNVQRLHDAAGAAIREVDKRNLILYGEVTWDNFVTGFTHAPGGPDYRNLTVLSFHYYKFSSGGPNVGTITECFKDRKKDAKRLGSGLMMTEFSVPDHEFYDAIELADRNGIGWMTWQYKLFFPITGTGNTFFDLDTGEVIPGTPELYSRSYVSAVQGVIVPGTFYFNATSGDLVFSYWADPEIQGDTEVRLQTKVHYPKGYRVFVQPAGAATWSVAKNSEYLISFRADRRLVKGTRIDVLIESR